MHILIFQHMATKVHIFQFVFLLFIISCLWTPNAAEWNITPMGDTLKAGDKLNSTSYLVSAKRKFVLGFQPQYENTDNDERYFLAITDWTEAFMVYVANIDNPIAKDSGMLTLSNDGTLKITLKGGDPIVLYTSFAQPITNTVVATLLDSGNFVLKELHSNGSTKRVLWQSFDHPEDTLLPGMKLGVNHKTGQTWSLRSSLGDKIIAPGPFTLEWDPKGGQLIILRRGVVYWESGVLRGNKFQNILPDKTKPMYDFIVVSNKDEEYFTFNHTDQSQLSILVLNAMGELQDLEGSSIARADMCYGYNTDGGCQKWKQPVCRHRGDTYDLKPAYFYTNSSEISNSSLGMSDCRDACWNNCSCVAFFSLFVNGTGCQLWTNRSKFIYGNVGQAYFLLPKPSRSGTKKRIWIGTIIAIVLLSIFSFVLCYLIRRKGVLKGNNKTKVEKEFLDLVTSTSDRSIDVNDIQNGGEKGHDLTVFSYACVMAATNNFSLANKLGEGGFGPVYKGELLTGQNIAVKRLSRHSGQGVIEFKNELILISKLQHMNLVKLLGCCISEEERMLIYEFMPNKSLDYFIFDSNKSKLLDWKKRLNIIEGIAQGLIYLHKYSRLRVIHRDLKASNILLDENMNPKISDFGMARIFQQNKQEASTTRVVGTYGYMSPEYAMEGVYSIKSDVYSFGVLMLEVLSGRKNSSFYNIEHPLNLVGYAWDLWKEGTGIELMDPTLSDTCIEQQLLRCVQVSLLCVEESAVARPTMSDVISMLTNENMPLPMPKRPAFSFGGKASELFICGNESEIQSVNDLTLSNMTAR